MGVDVDKIRAGDEVTVRAKVVAVASLGGALLARFGSAEFSVAPFQIETHTRAPKSFAPGDKVIIPDSDTLAQTHEVVAAFGPWVWLSSKGEHPFTRRAEDLELVA